MLVYIIRSNILRLLSVLFTPESWDNTIFVYKVQFLLSVIWYDRGERRLFNPSPAYLFQLFLNRCNKFDHNLHNNVSLLPKIARISDAIRVYMKWDPNIIRACMMS